MVNILSEESILEKAASLCLKNAKQYIKDADLLYSFKSYGHALSLTVLSDVELGKTVIYNLWSKNLIKEDILPSYFRPIFREKKYDLFASETWWIGFVIASNVHELVQSLIDVSEEAGDLVAKRELSAVAKKRIAELIKKMNNENNLIGEFEDYLRQGFFVDFGLPEIGISTPAMVERALVREHLRRAKQRINFCKPFLSLSLSEVSRIIAQIFLKEAFESILLLRSRISRFTLPDKNQGI